MKLFKIVVLFSVVILIFSCAEVNKNIKIHPDYAGKTINKKTLLIQSVENDSIFLEFTGGLDDDVRKGESKDLFNKLIKEDLAWRIKQNSTFRKVKYESVEDSSKYDFTLKLSNLSVRMIEANESTGVTKSGFMKLTNNGLQSEFVSVKLSLFGEFEIVDNKTNKIVLSGTITEIGNDTIDFGKTKKMKESQNKMINKELTKKFWNKAVEDFGLNLMSSTPFHKKKEKNKYKYLNDM